MKFRITVQALNQIDGSLHEAVANVTADSEQSAVNRLITIGKVEWAYKFLGEHGYVSPSHGTTVTFPNYAGEWYVNEA